MGIVLYFNDATLLYSTFNRKAYLCYVGAILRRGRHLHQTLMDPARWQKITSVFQAAREMPPADRPAYLERVCAPDFELRQQVERLLLNDVDETAFLDPESLQSAVSGRDTFVPGTEVLHYRLVAKLGHGGMGEVFKALDKRLGRFVALKFLAAPQAVLEDRQGRFLREARAASALDHPNICTIHGLEEAPDGRRFIVMACYEGETLKERIQKGPIPQSDAVSLAVQIGEGLSQAHAAGIIHRDIKPANIIVIRDGLVKILDFGIAKLTAEERVTQPGAAFGTIEYMSPEQALGERVDHRTDIWAVGVLLYEMLSGRLPFRGEDARGTFAAILNRDPAPLVVRFNVSAALEAIIKKALSKDPGARYQRMSDLVSVLKQLQETEIPGDRTEVSSIRPVPSIAVLPFVSLGPGREQDYFANGLTDELINALARLEGLRVVSRTTVFQFKGQAIDVRELARRLQVNAVLEGSVREADGRVRIAVQLVKAVDGCQLWSEQYDRPLDNVFALQDEIVRKIVEKLAARLQGSPQDPLVKLATRNSQAYRLYLIGRHHCSHWTPEGLQTGMGQLRQALSLDPAFAKAHAGLAAAHLLQGFWGLAPPGEAWPAARQAAQTALQLDDSLGEAHACLGAVLAITEFDWAEAAREFDLALRWSPGDSQIRSWFTAFYLVPQGLLEQARQQGQLCAELDPLSPIVGNSLAWTLHLLKQHEAALSQARSVLELSPEMLAPRWTVALSLLGLGQVHEALVVISEAAVIDPHNSFTLALLIGTQVAAGQLDAALRTQEQLEQLSLSRFVAPTHLALASLTLGEKDQAFHWLSQGLEIRDVMLLYLKTLPVYDSIRDDPRFAGLLERLGLSSD
ncbi:MAG TPA: protein kinase [Terriglobia bacterium]|nr:protein kinase [Terriglobia bacterium]